MFEIKQYIRNSKVSANTLNSVYHILLSSLALKVHIQSQHQPLFLLPFIEIKTRNIRANKVSAWGWSTSSIQCPRRPKVGWFALDDKTRTRSNIFGPITNGTVEPPRNTCPVQLDGTDCQAKHYFERNDDETDPWSGSRSGSRSVEERVGWKRGRKNESNHSTFLSQLYTDKPFHRVMRLPARNRSKTFCHAALDKLVPVSAIYARPLPLYDTFFSLWFV